MKILQLCYKPPFPPIDGGSMGMHSLTTGLLNNNHQVKVIAFNSYKHPCNVTLLPKEYVERTRFETIFVDLRIKPIEAFECWLTGQSYHVKRFINNQMKERLCSLLKEESFDVIQLESIFLAPYIPIIRKLSDAKLVLRAPNIEHLIWKRTAKATKNPFKKYYLKHLALTLERYELDNINNFDGIYPVTQVDANFFKEKGCRKPCVGVPVGIDSPDIISDIFVEPDTVFHIGSMNWLPNEQGIKWFIEQVWDLILAKLPNAKAYFAGRDMPNWLLDLNKEGVNIVGEVSDSVKFMSSKEIMVVPLLSGSGIRIKIIEAMSIGKCVIATSVAAEGIMYENNKNIVIADTPTEFAQAVCRCISDKEFSSSIAKEAYKLIAQKYNTNAIAKQLTELYSQINK